MFAVKREMLNDCISNGNSSIKKKWNQMFQTENSIKKHKKCFLIPLEDFRHVFFPVSFFFALSSYPHHFPSILPVLWWNYTLPDVGREVRAFDYVHSLSASGLFVFHPIFRHTRLLDRKETQEQECQWKVARILSDKCHANQAFIRRRLITDTLSNTKVIF